MQTFLRIKFHVATDKLWIYDFKIGKNNFPWNEPLHDKTNKMACAPSEDSDQPGHLPSLIRVFAVHMKKAGVFSYPLSAQRRLWSDWVDAQADLSLFWAYMVMIVFAIFFLNPSMPSNPFFMGPRQTVQTQRTRHLISAASDVCFSTWISIKNKIKMKKVHQTPLKWQMHMSS